MKFGLIGYPIGHSLSPALFRAGYDGRYRYDLIETDDFEEAYSRFVKGYDGINVTAPFKELAYSKADIVSEECRLIGATNLLIKTPEGITAYNSDFRGLCLWLRWSAGTEGQKSVLPPWPQGVGPAPKEWEWFFSAPQYPLTPNVKVLIAGLGGAGKAAAAAAWSLGMKMTLMNRDISKAHDMAHRLGQFENNTIRIRPLSEFREAFREADIIIYNLPVQIPQLHSLTDKDFMVNGEAKRKHILEANYKVPSFDKDILDRMSAANPEAKYTEGKIWLLLQAVTGYEIFTGEKPDLSKMTEQI